MKQQYTNSEMLNLIEEHIHSERDRAILIDRYINGLTFSELEDKHHLSERQIKRIVYKGDSIILHLL